MRGQYILNVSNFSEVKVSTVFVVEQHSGPFCYERLADLLYDHREEPVKVTRPSDGLGHVHQDRQFKHLVAFRVLARAQNIAHNSLKLLHSLFRSL